MGKNLKGKELGKGIRQKKNNVYEARAVVNGISICVSNLDLKVCMAEFSKAKEQAAQNVDIRNQTITLNEWFEEWFTVYKEPHIKETSVFPMKSKFRNTFGTQIGDMKIVDICNIDIQNVINNMKAEGRAVSSMRDALGRVRECLESAKNNRIIPINPCFDITVPWENHQVERRFLTVDEQNTFLKKVETECCWYKEMFYIMFLTGMRVGEVGGLKWEDVDFKNKCIHINRSLSIQYEAGVKKMRLTTPKTHNSYRTIPFMGEAEEMFLSQKSKQDAAKKELGSRWRDEGFEDLVFTSSMGSPVIRHSAEKRINRVVDEINKEEIFQAIRERREPVLFEKVYPHAIRHTFCSRCFEKGMNPKYVQGLMGHQHYSTTIDIYTHVPADKMQNEAEKFGNAVM